jgi:hypothetical protein
MEDLIPFLLFIIVGILSAMGKVKKEKKKKQRVKARRRNGLVARIHAWLTDLQKRIQIQSEKAPKGIREWEQLIGRSQLERTQPLPYDDALGDIDRDAVKKTPAPLPKATVSATSPQPHMPIEPPEKPNMMAVEPPRMAKTARRKPIPSTLPRSRSGLRTAIVWSEILGPPIALRDPFGDNR